MSVKDQIIWHKEEIEALSCTILLEKISVGKGKLRLDNAKSSSR